MLGTNSCQVTSQGGDRSIPRLSPLGLTSAWAKTSPAAERELLSPPVPPFYPRAPSTYPPGRPRTCTGRRTTAAAAAPTSPRLPPPPPAIDHRAATVWYSITTAVSSAVSTFPDNCRTLTINVGEVILSLPLWPITFVETNVTSQLTFRERIICLKIIIFFKKITYVDRTELFSKILFYLIGYNSFIIYMIHLTDGTNTSIKYFVNILVLCEKKNQVNICICHVKTSDSLINDISTCKEQRYFFF